jgi:O-succinylbenzoate synthase
VIPSASEPLYEFLINTYEKAEKKLKSKILTVLDDIEDLPSEEVLEGYREAGENSIFVFDDLITSSKKTQQYIGDIWIRFRKFDCSSIFLTQTFMQVPKIMRQNSNYIIIKSCSESTDLAMILRQYPLGKTKKQLIDLYERCNTGVITNFFMIDIQNPDPRMKIRHNYEPFDD